MTLYAVKIDGEYIRDLKENGWARVSLAKCSVFPTVSGARALAEKAGAGAAVLIRMELHEEEIPWP